MTCSQRVGKANRVATSYARRGGQEYKKCCAGKTESGLLESEDCRGRRAMLAASRLASLVYEDRRRWRPRLGSGARHYQDASGVHVRSASGAVRARFDSIRAPERARAVADCRSTTAEALQGAENRPPLAADSLHQRRLATVLERRERDFAPGSVRSSHRLDSSPRH